MIDKFDYAEPACPLCGGKEFYYPDKNAPLGRIPIARIIDKVDALFDKNDYVQAGKLLEYWEGEAKELRDRNGELSIQSELIGYYRKVNEKQKGLVSVKRALTLLEELNQSGTVSGATILINCATAFKAFDMPREALPLYKQAEAIYALELEEGDSRFGGLYNNMAVTLAELGDYDGAERAYELALNVMQKVDRGELESAITYVNMAHAYESCGRSEKIAECMRKAYALLYTKGILHDGYFAFVLEKCAPSFEYFGLTKESEEMLEESKRIYARA